MLTSPLKLPAVVSIRAKGSKGGDRVNGVFHWADDPKGMITREKIHTPDGKLSKCLYILEFPDHTSSVPGATRFFVRPTSAEQFVKNSSTGKGWQFLDANLQDSDGNLIYHSLLKIRDSVGFENDPKFTQQDRTRMHELAKEKQRKRKRQEYNDESMARIASSLLKSGIYIKDSQWKEFVKHVHS